jgi:hypothetical protein
MVQNIQFTVFLMWSILGYVKDSDIKAAVALPAVPRI